MFIAENNFKLLSSFCYDELEELTNFKFQQESLLDHHQQKLSEIVKLAEKELQLPPDDLDISNSMIDMLLP